MEGKTFMLTLDFIKETVAPLAEKYDVAKVELFGSYANGNATEKSDVDFLVLFNVKIPSLFDIMGLQEELKVSLDCSVDVVPLPLARPELIKIDKVVSIYERT